MALTFGAATSDRVVCGSAASLDNLDPFTVLAWVYPTTLTAGRRVFEKLTTDNNVRLNLAAGNVRFIRARATTSTDYITNSTPLSATNSWIFFALTYASASTPTTHIYTGNLTTAITEATYGTATDGSGALTDDAAENWVIGNKAAATFNSAWQGAIGHFSIYNVVLTSAQIEAQRLRQFVGSGCVMFLQLGFDGTGTQTDFSGNSNTGAVTGATASAHHPYIIPAYSVLAQQSGIIRTGSSLGAIG